MDMLLPKDRRNHTGTKVKIDSFVDSVYLYDDRIVLTFNYKDGLKTVPLTDIDGSGLNMFDTSNSLISSLNQRYSPSYTHSLRLQGDNFTVIPACLSR
jgi:hypothetical protein